LNDKLVWLVHRKLRVHPYRIKILGKGQIGMHEGKKKDPTTRVVLIGEHLPGSPERSIIHDQKELQGISLGARRLIMGSGGKGKRGS